ncbi:MAG: helix-turn-helix transcriptional regulator [Nitriliruptoraceae bacterium]|nr:helix-turn-helix transcriptional regulator [Nitriliruptoraceae bacterium]
MERTLPRPSRAGTRARLLDAAAAAFAGSGFHATSVEELAQRAGLTKGAVYSNFDSKEELFLALLERNVDEIVRLVEHLLELPVTERLTALPTALGGATVLGEAWTLLELEFVLYAARNPRWRGAVQARRARTAAALTTLVARHLDDLGVDDTAARAPVVARLLTAGADGLAIAALTDDTVEVADGLTVLVDALTGAASD